MKMNKISFFSLILLSTASYASDEEGFYTCIPCPAGTYLSGNECKLCPRGTFSRGGSTSCESCPPGQYSEVTGDMDNRNCKTCPAGYACPGGTDKQACPYGTWAPAGSASCRDCQKLELHWGDVHPEGLPMEWGHNYNQHENCQWGGDKVPCMRVCYVQTFSKVEEINVKIDDQGNRSPGYDNHGNWLSFTRRSTDNSGWCNTFWGDNKRSVFIRATCRNTDGARILEAEGMDGFVYKYALYL